MRLQTPDKTARAYARSSVESYAEYTNVYIVHVSAIGTQVLVAKLLNVIGCARDGGCDGSATTQHNSLTHKHTHKRDIYEDAMSATQGA